jgi:acetolactate synthase small subunit
VGRTDDRDGASVVTEPSMDALLDSLAHPYRRHVLRALVEREPSTTLLALSWEVTSRLDETVRATVQRPVLDRVRARLHHVHLPKLAAVDVVDYDTAYRTVELTADPDRLVRFLDAVPTD